MIPDHIKEEVKAASDIVEVISDHVKLRRSGSNFMGLCPFHNEKSPSFNVSPSIGIYKCFGCGESGDVFSFVMKQEGVSFTEAVRALGKRFGVDVPEEETPEDDERFRRKEGIYHALAFAGRFFFKQLTGNPEAEAARKYLDKRGFKTPTVRQYGVGYAPDSFDALISAAAKEKINESYLEQAGLIKYSRNGEKAFDVFRKRIMFPIFNTSGKVIAFGGRIMPGEEKGPKYINSPQTEVYNKSEVLYGLHIAKNEIRKSSETILVEGYTDVLSMHQAGVKNAVATSGTSLTAGQLRVMHRYGKTLLMIYDSDLAGQNAMTRGIDLALREGLDVRLLQLPVGEDPDSFVRQFGAESFLSYKDKHALDFITFGVEKARQSGKWEDPFHRTTAITALLRSIAQIPDTLAQEAYVQKLSSLTNMADRTLHKQLEVQRAEVRHARDKEAQREERQANFQSNRASAGGVPQRGFPAEGGPDLRESVPQGGPASQLYGDDVPWPEDRDYQGGLDEPDNLGSPGATAGQQGAKATTGYRRPAYERQLLRLMLENGYPMVEYIGSQCNEDHFEDEQFKELFLDMVGRYEKGEPISVSVYTAQSGPVASLVGEIMLDRHTPSERSKQRLAGKPKPDVYKLAKGELRVLKLHYLSRLSEQFQQAYASATEDEQKSEYANALQEVLRKRIWYENGLLDDLFPNPDQV